MEARKKLGNESWLGEKYRSLELKALSMLLQLIWCLLTKPAAAIQNAKEGVGNEGQLGEKQQGLE